MEIVKNPNEVMLKMIRDLGIQIHDIGDLVISFGEGPSLIEEDKLSSLRMKLKGAMDNRRQLMLLFISEYGNENQRKFINNNKNITA